MHLVVNLDAISDVDEEWVFIIKNDYFFKNIAEKSSTKEIHVIFKNYIYRKQIRFYL